MSKMRLLACASAGLASLSAGAAHADGGGRFEYAASFLCGDNPAAEPRVLVGDYATSVSLHNPSRRDANIDASIALTFPPGGPSSGGAFDLVAPTSVPARSALSIDCDAIFEASQAQAPYIQGMLVVRSSRRLNVARTQTASPDVDFEGAGAVASIDVDRIAGRRIGGD